eukprot:COSAG01_NODE_605_length_14890_cov_10.929417_9_plen_112_part_00
MPASDSVYSCCLATRQSDDDEAFALARIQPFQLRILRGSAENCRQKELQTVNLYFTLEFLRVHASSTTSAHHLGNHEEKLATLEIMFRAIRTRKIWPLASPRVVPKSVPNP